MARGVPKGYVGGERFESMRNVMRNLSHIGVPNSTFEVLCGWKKGRAENIRCGAQKSVSQEDFAGYALARPYLIQIYKGLRDGFAQVGHKPKPYRQITAVRNYGKGDKK